MKTDKEEMIEDQEFILRCAKAYERGEQVVEDKVYDMCVRRLQRSVEANPKLWEEVCMPQFKDGSWQYTGMFYK